MKFNLLMMFQHYASRLRFPKLLAITAVLLAVDLLTPDLVPFADEILLALLTALFASLKKRGGAGDGAPRR